MLISKYLTWHCVRYKVDIIIVAVEYSSIWLHCILKIQSLYCQAFRLFLIFFLNFLLWNFYRLTGSYKNSTENPWVPYIQFPMVVTSYITLVQQQTWEINIGITYSSYSDFTGLTGSHLWICVHVWWSMQFYCMSRFGDPPLESGYRAFHHYQDSSYYPFIIILALLLVPDPCQPLIISPSLCLYHYKSVNKFNHTLWHL